MAPRRSTTPSRKRTRKCEGEDIVESDYFTEEEAPSRSKRSKSVEPGKIPKSPATKRPALTRTRSKSATPAVKSAKQLLLFNNLPQPQTTDGNTHIAVFGLCEFGQAGMGLQNLSYISEPRLQTGLQADSPYSMPAEITACGSYHTIVLCEDGRLYSYGASDHGALGRSTSSEEYSREELETMPLPVNVSDDFKIARIGCGASFSLMLSTAGDVRFSGAFRSTAGLLAHQGQLITWHPRRPDLPNVAFSMMACGSDHVVLLDVFGHVWTFGSGQQGQLGRKIFERRKEQGLKPEKIGLKKIKLVAAGQYHSFAVDHKGAVFAFGLNSHRQTGINEEDGGYLDIVFQATQIRALHPSKHAGSKIVDITGGEAHTLFLFDNGKVFVCGRCDGHESGLAEDHEAMQQAVRLDGSDQSTSGIKYLPLPVEVPFPREADGSKPFITSVCAKNRQSVAFARARLADEDRNLCVSKAGTVYSFGTSPNAALGFADVTVQQTPRKIESRDIEGMSCLSASLGSVHAILVVAKRTESSQL